MIFIIFIINIPQVSFDTARFTGQVRVVPVAGTVCHGAGTVWENPTRRSPVLNPTDSKPYTFGKVSFCLMAVEWHHLYSHDRT